MVGLGSDKSALSVCICMPFHIILSFLVFEGRGDKILARMMYGKKPQTACVKEWTSLYFIRQAQYQFV